MGEMGHLTDLLVNLKQVAEFSTHRVIFVHCKGFSEKTKINFNGGLKEIIRFE